MSMDAFQAQNFTYDGLERANDYRKRTSYDPNGNIRTYYRGGVGNVMDYLVYLYPKEGGTGTPLNNRLRGIFDGVFNDDLYPSDIDNQTSFGSREEAEADQSPERDDDNYLYDEIGNLVKDRKANIKEIGWTVYGKIALVTKTPESGGEKIAYTYDASGNRISKVLSVVGSESTFYVRDAQGNVMAVYAGNDERVTQNEIDLYGSSRLGLVSGQAAVENLPETDEQGYGPARVSTFTRGEKQYELSNHLGNVLTTISDRRQQGTSDNISVRFYTAEVVSATDYYPFGMEMPERTMKSAGYRYGFNGKENDNDVKGDGNELDYGMRIYDSRIGRFLSTDPLTKEYPWYTPYQFAGNTPIQAVDLDGEEESHYTLTLNKKNGVSTLIRTSVKQLPSTNMWGRKYPGGQLQRAIVQYNNQTYHIGFSDDDPDAMAIFNVWKNYPDASNFEALFMSDEQRGNASLKRLIDQSRNIFAQIINQAVPAGFSNFEPVQMKGSEPGGKEINKQVKEIANGRGKSRLDANGKQKLFENKKNTANEIKWEGASEFEVEVPGRPNVYRILRKEVGKDKDGNPLYIYGWSRDHYESPI